MWSSQVEGITLDIMRKAIAQAGDGRRHILGEMAKCNPAPRGNLSAYAPKVVRFKVGPVVTFCLSVYAPSNIWLIITDSLV